MKEPSGRKSHTKKFVLFFLIIFAAVTVVLQPSLRSNLLNPAHPIPSDSVLRGQISKTLSYIYGNINPDTYLAYSLPGDRRLKYWSVVYDDAMRCIAHIRTGDIPSAKKTLAYFMDNTAIQKVGYVFLDGKLTRQPGWIINIVDASEPRMGGRGVEHIALTGPNVYLGIAAVHLYRATEEKKYLEYARNRWTLVKALQNEDPSDVNYGGVRMGPMGSPDNPLEQKLEFDADNPSFYEFYNGEHAADFKALSDLLSEVDPEHFEAYRQTSRLIGIWDKKIYDRKVHLFFIGTTEKKYFDSNIGQWIEPGVIPMYPLDTSALKICAYGVKGLEPFEPQAAEKIRKAIEKHFKVTVKSTIGGKVTSVTGYDFVGDLDREKLVMYEEEGPNGDVKNKKGMGRKPLLSDEWTTWVAFVDLRLSRDFKAMGEYEKASHYLNRYKQNALCESFRTGALIDRETVAYPYVHPMSEGFNKPVGFGWNTHHAPFSMIGGVARIMGILGADPFQLDPVRFSYQVQREKFKLADYPNQEFKGLITEPEMYINKAWTYVETAQQKGPDAEQSWLAAAETIEDMISNHNDWTLMAAQQNMVAKKSSDPFPLMDMGGLTTKDLEPVYRKYWALYHVGTGEYIRYMSYRKLATYAKKRKDLTQVASYKRKAKDVAQRLSTQYYFTQAYDKGGWLWQPALCLRDSLN